MLDSTSLPELAPLYAQDKFRNKDIWDKAEVTSKVVIKGREIEMVWACEEVMCKCPIEEV